LSQVSKNQRQRVSELTREVKDLRASKGFYVDAFGWKAIFESKEIIFSQTRGMVFALFQRDQRAADFQATRRQRCCAPHSAPALSDLRQTL
jgi:predicted enzyme related to lactoylglutathione lyase